MSKWVKNNSGADKTYVGQLIADQAYYQIQPTEEIAWANHSPLLTDVGSGAAVIAKDDSGTTDIADVNEAINYLKDNLPRDVITEFEADKGDFKMAKGKGSTKRNITNVSRTANVATITTDSGHAFKVGQKITVDADDDLYDVVEADITAIPAADQLSYANTGSDEAQKAATGTAVGQCTEVIIKIPGTLGAVTRLIFKGSAWFGNGTHPDDFVKVDIVDYDNLLGAGAGFIPATFNDEDMPSDQQGHYFKMGEISIGGIAGYGNFIGGLYLVICGVTGSVRDDSLYCNLDWLKPK